MRRRVIVLIALVAAQLALASQAMATFPWPIIGGGS